MTPRLKIREAAEVVRAGGVIAYPTEAVFGLGCNPHSCTAVEYLCAIKRRPLTAGLILIADRLERLAAWIDPGTAEIAQLDHQPARPVSWIVTAAPKTPVWITGGRATIAVRVTRHPVAASLCAAVGSPLVSTSANRRGRPPARTALGVRRQFRDEIDFVVPGVVGAASGPSEIRDARTGAVLRPG